MSRELDLSQLTTELTDFLGLPGDLDLPAVTSVECRRTIDGPWRVRGFLAATGGDLERYEAISRWAAYAGGEVEVSKPYVSPAQPSGMQRTLTTRIVIAEVPIELASCTDGLFVAPSPRPACEASTQRRGVTYRCVRGEDHDNALCEGYDGRLGAHFNPMIGEFAADAEAVQAR